MLDFVRKKMITSFSVVYKSLKRRIFVEHSVQFEATKPTQQRVLHKTNLKAIFQYKFLIMKKFITLFTLLLLFGCNKDDSSKNHEESTEFKSLSVNLTLPENSNISSEDLTVSSLFTEENQIVSGISTIETVNEDSMELTFATNSHGNIIMLSYFNPLNVETVEINTESTAVAMIMLHPWTFDLSANAKADAIEYIKNLSEFQDFKNTVGNSIADGQLEPLHASEVLNKVTEIQTILFNRTTKYIAPLTFDLQNSNAKIINEASSASYSIGLYDENDVLLEHKLAKGLDKSHQIYQDFISNDYTFSVDNDQTVQFDIPYKGEWTLKAKSGLSFDNSLENLQAVYDNSSRLGFDILGLFSTNLKKILKVGDCPNSLGQKIYNGISGSSGMSSNIKEVKNGTKSYFTLALDFASFIGKNASDVVDTILNCAPPGTKLYGLDKLKLGPFKKLSNYLNILDNIDSAFNGSALLTDWLQYDSEIEYCFRQFDDESFPCELKDLLLNYKWKETLVNDFKYTDLKTYNCTTGIEIDEVRQEPCLMGQFEFEFFDDGLVAFTNSLLTINQSNYTLDGNILNIRTRMTIDTRIRENELFLTFNPELNRFEGTNTYTFRGTIGAFGCFNQGPCTDDVIVELE